MAEESSREICLCESDPLRNLYAKCVCTSSQIGLDDVAQVVSQSEYAKC